MRLQFTTFLLHQFGFPCILQLISLDTAEQIRFLDQIVEQALLPNELSRTVEFGDSAPIQYDDAVTVQDRIDPVGNGDDGLILEHAGTQGGLQHGIGLYIDGGLRLLVGDRQSRQQNSQWLRLGRGCCLGPTGHGPRTPVDAGRH